MASHEDASQPEAASPSFGGWLRQLREGNGVILRQLAAAADMDPSHLGKVERGERLPTKEQASAIARFLGFNEMQMRVRVAAARMLQECEGDAALAHQAAGFVQEEAAPYLVNKPANNTVKKPRTKR